MKLARQSADLAGASANFGLRVNMTQTGSAGPSGCNYTLRGSIDLELFGSSTAHVAFGAAGALLLDDSQGLSGAIAGLAPGNSIDLADIVYVAGKTPGYTANNANTGGALTIGDGTHTANLALIGNYLAADSQLPATAIAARSLPTLHWRSLPARSPDQSACLRVSPGARNRSRRDARAEAAASRSCVTADRAGG